MITKCKDCISVYCDNRDKLPEGGCSDAYVNIKSKKVLTDTLIIEEVDLDLLDYQRIDLNCLIDSKEVSDTYMDSLKGIASMLDHWSDIRKGKINNA